MGGSSSKSQTSQQVETTTQTADASGIVGDVFQGQQVDYVNQFAPDVSARFEQALNLVSAAGEKLVDSFDKIAANLFDVTEDALAAAKTANNQAIEKISENEVAQANPEFAAIQKFLPLGILAVVGFVVYAIWRK